MTDSQECNKCEGSRHDVKLILILRRLQICYLGLVNNVMIQTQLNTLVALTKYFWI